MAGWSKITDLRLVPEFEKAHIPPDGRCVLAVDVYFKAIDENNNQMDRLPETDIHRAVDLIEGRDGKEKIKYVDHVSEVPSGANYWFYTLHTDGAVRASASGSNAGTGQDDIYIDWPSGDTGKKPSEGDGEHEKPVPQHSGKDYQHIRYYVGCGYVADRALTLGISIKPPQSKDTYLSWTGGSGEHHFGITLDLMAAGPAFDPTFRPGKYLIIPTSHPDKRAVPDKEDERHYYPLVVSPTYDEDWTIFRFENSRNENSKYFYIINERTRRCYFYQGTGIPDAGGKDYEGFQHSNNQYFHSIEFFGYDRNYGCSYLIKPYALVSGKAPGYWALYKEESEIMVLNGDEIRNNSCFTWYLRAVS